MVRHFIAESWPQVFDDSQARNDWGWNHQYGIDELTNIMIDALEPIYAAKKKEMGAM